MRWLTYDIECFAHDWIVVFKDRETRQYTVIHNDNETLKEFLSDDAVYCGFNSKFYDQYIIKGIVAGFTPQELKTLNDWIIAGNQGWQYPAFNGFYFRFNNVDIRDDVQAGLSLKAIEGHLWLPIKESDVDFNINRPLTKDELNRTIEYCKHDVDAAELLTEIRKDYLKTKLNLGKRAGIDSVKALGSTNAKLTAMMLKATPTERTDGREYVYPENLDISVIPREILDFFDTIHDLSVPDEELFKTSLSIAIGDMPCKYAWGGVHGSLTGYFEEATENRVIQNRDVSSLYPSLIEIYGYLSRNVPDPQLFYQIRKDRIKAKHEGDKQTAKVLKLPLNTVSGAQENKYNDLYDPLPTRSMRISGQLFLTVLTVRLLDECKTIKLLNLNTDGLMYSIDKSELPIADRICREWETETKFELEVDDIKKVWIKDVNNLLIIKTNDEVKTVGGYLNYGISTKGAWAINNTAIIIKKAITEYFVYNTPIENTVNNCDDISDFQIIAKAGTTYDNVYHVVNGEKIPVQRVNRVYATADTTYGKLYKVKAEDDSEAKIDSLPEHCIIDNDNQLSISDIDKTFYVEMARKRVNDFKSIKPEKKKATRRTKKMASTTTKSKNIYERLTIVRDEFAKIGIEKNGKNMQLTSKFFTLDDIVNKSRSLFHKNRILPLDMFTKEEATLTLLDLDNPDTTITFSIPMREYMGNAAVTPVQAMGATVTYYRRYLYSLALDLAEKDELEEGFSNAPASKAKAPATPEQRQEVKEELTAPADNATKLQIRGLKNVLKKLKDADPSKEELIANIAIDTQGFTVISKADCETLIERITTMLGEGGET